MTTEILDHYEIAARLPSNAAVVFRDVGWDDYERLLERVGDAGNLRISYDNGILQAMSPSAEHESYACFFDKLATIISLRLRIDVRSFGSSTLKKRQQRKGTEPDACFYVQSAPLIGNRLQLDFNADPPPDTAVEIDIHDGSLDKFPIYGALGVPEVWHFDGRQLRIHLLDRDEYRLADQSRALPFLTASVLTESLTRLRDDGEFRAIHLFDEWLRTQRS